MSEQILIQKKPPKSQAAAGILSGLCPGVGQIYNGQVAKGILFLVLFAGLISIQPRGGQPFTAFMMIGLYVYQIIEAVQTAGAINRRAAGLPVDPVQDKSLPEIPEGLPTGSVFWGAILMFLGVVFLLGNFRILNYDRFWDFWPVIVIVIGFKMIADYFSKKNA